MERLLERLDRRLGKFAIPNLMAIVVVGMGIVWALSMRRPDLVSRIDLDFYAVRRGELWRLISFVLVPIPTTPMWMLVNLYFLWWVGASLEQHWGSFKFNVYYFTGVLAAVVAAYFTGHASSFWLNDASPLLAFATLFPDVEILLFFIIPIRVKWLGIVTAVLVAVAFAQAGPMTRASVAASLVSYVLFFAAHWRDVLRGRQLQVRQRARRVELEASVPVFGQRVCAICGAKEADGADIRVCSCEKCDRKQRALCLEHARNH
jgi:hypothetical protein